MPTLPLHGLQSPSITLSPTGHTTAPYKHSAPPFSNALPPHKQTTSAPSTRKPSRLTSAKLQLANALRNALRLQRSQSIQRIRQPLLPSAPPSTPESDAPRVNSRNVSNPWNNASPTRKTSQPRSNDASSNKTYNLNNLYSRQTQRHAHQ